MSAGRFSRIIGGTGREGWRGERSIDVLVWRETVRLRLGATGSVAGVGGAGRVSRDAVRGNRLLQVARSYRRAALLPHRAERDPGGSHRCERRAAGALALGEEMRRIVAKQE